MYILINFSAFQTTHHLKETSVCTKPGNFFELWFSLRKIPMEIHDPKPRRILIHQGPDRRLVFQQFQHQLCTSSTGSKVQGWIAFTSGVEGEGWSLRIQPIFLGGVKFGVKLLPFLNCLEAYSFLYDLTHIMKVLLASMLTCYLKQFLWVVKPLKAQ